MFRRLITLAWLTILILGVSITTAQTEVLPTPTETATETATPSATATETATASATATATASATATATASATATATASATATATASATTTETSTSTTTATASATTTETSTASITPLNSATPAPILADCPTNTDTWLASVPTDRTQLSNNHSLGYPSISADGQWVAFASSASNLVLNDTNGFADVFLYNRVTCTLTLVSMTYNGAQANNMSTSPRISDDGRYVAFASLANNLVATDTNAVSDIFIRDTLNNTTQRISVANSAQEANGSSIAPEFVAGMNAVIYFSEATNLSATLDQNNATASRWDVFVYDLATQQIQLVSNPSNSLISADTTYIDGFYTNGNLYVLYNRLSNSVTTAMLKNVTTNTEWVVGRNDSGIVSNGSTKAIALTLSNNQFTIVFTDNGENANPTSDSQLYSRVVDISDPSTGSTQAINLGLATPYTLNAVSADSQFAVVYAIPNIYIANLVSGDKQILSTNTSMQGGYGQISRNSTDLVFISDSPNHFVGDTNGFADVYVLKNPLGLVTAQSFVSAMGLESETPTPSLTPSRTPTPTWTPIPTLTLRPTVTPLGLPFVFAESFNNTRLSPDLSPLFGWKRSEARIAPLANPQSLQYRYSIAGDVTVRLDVYFAGVNPNAQIRINVHENKLSGDRYRLTIHTNGTISMYRNATLIGQTMVASYGEYALTFNVRGNTISANIESDRGQLGYLIYTDPTPFTSGFVSLEAASESVGINQSTTIDNFYIYANSVNYVNTTATPYASLTPSPTPVGPTKTNTVTPTNQVVTLTPSSTYYLPPTPTSTPQNCSPGNTQMIIDPDNFNVGYLHDLSGDGRWVAYTEHMFSTTSQVMLYDRTTCISKVVKVNQPDYSSGINLSLSHDGRYLAFESLVYDQQTQTFEGIPTPIQTKSQQAMGISADGRYVLLALEGAKDPNTSAWINDFYLYDRQTKAFTRIFDASSLPQSNGFNTFLTSWSADNRYFIYNTYPTNTYLLDRNKGYIFDYNTKTTKPIAIDPRNGQVADADSAIISADGRYITFLTSTSLVAIDKDVTTDLYRLDQQTQTYTLLSSNVTNVNYIGDVTDPLVRASDFTRNGRYVVFMANLNRNLAPDDFRAYVRDLQTNTLYEVPLPVAVKYGGDITESNGGSKSATLKIAEDASYVTFLDYQDIYVVPFSRFTIAPVDIPTPTATYTASSVPSSTYAPTATPVGLPFVFGESFNNAVISPDISPIYGWDVVNRSDLAVVNNPQPLRYRYPIVGDVTANISISFNALVSNGAFKLNVHENLATGDKYTLMIDKSGQVQLYRGTILLQQGTINTTGLITLTLNIRGNTIKAEVNARTNLTLSYNDVTPLPGGTVSIESTVNQSGTLYNMNLYANTVNFNSATATPYATLTPTATQTNLFTATPATTLTPLPTLTASPTLYLPPANTDTPFVCKYLEKTFDLPSFWLKLSGNGQWAVYLNASSNAKLLYLHHPATCTTRQVFSTYGTSETIQTPLISEDGRYVAFSVNSFIYHFDVQTNTLQSVPSPLPNTAKSAVEMSPDGRYLLIQVRGNNPDYPTSLDTQIEDYYLFDIQLRTWLRVFNDASRPKISPIKITEWSADLRYFVYEYSSALGVSHVQPAYLYDRSTNTTIPVVTNPNNAYPSNPSYVQISADGRYIGFLTTVALVATDTDVTMDAYVLDRQTNTYRLVSVDSTGKNYIGDVAYGADYGMAFTKNGRYMAFVANLSPQQSPINRHIFVVDLQLNKLYNVPVPAGYKLGDGSYQFNIMLAEDASAVVVGRWFIPFNQWTEVVPDPATATPTQTPQALTASPLDVTTLVDHRVTIVFRANGSLPYTISNISTPTNGTLTEENGQWVYTPKNGFIGRDSITFTATDTSNQSVNGLVTISVLPAPTLSPANLSFITAVRPIFSWTPITGSVKYRLQVDNDPSFGSPEINTLVASTVYVTPTTASALSQGIYYWRVGGTDTNATLPPLWSPVSQFTLFIGTSPLNNAVVPSNRPIFYWVAGSGCPIQYLQIDDDIDFGSDATTYQVSGSVSFYTLTSNLADGVYYWRVGTCNDTMAQVTYRQFTIVTVPIPTPILTMQAYYNVPNVPLRWTVPNGSNFTYELQVDTSALFDTDLEFTAVASTPDVPTSNLLDGRYYFRARAKSATAVYSPWSLSATFVVDTLAPTAVPTLSYPPDKFVTNNPRQAISWLPMPDATKYEVIFAQNAQCNGTPLPAPYTSFSLTTSYLAQGRWWWCVRGLDIANNAGAWSAIRYFDIDLQYLPAKDTVFTSLNGIYAPTMYWYASQNPYTLQVDDNSAFTSPDTYSGILLTYYKLPNLSNGTYYWRVKANTDTDWVYQRKFAITPAIPLPPTLTEPVIASYTNTRTPTLKWNAMTNITRYEVQISTDASFVANMQSLSVENATQINVPQLPESPSTLWYWRVRAIDTFGATGYWSALRYFFLDTVIPPAPNLASPLNASLVTTTKPYLYWSAVPYAKSYELVIDTDNLCDATPFAPTTLTYMVVPNTLAQGSYFWCVRTTDLAGNVSNFSLPFSFTVNLLYLPADNTIFNSLNGVYSPTVYWIGVPGVTSYTILLDDNPNFTTPDSYPVGNTTYYKLPNLANGTYFWQVIPTGFPPLTPVSRKFTITPSIPLGVTLTEPLIASYTNNTAPTLKWNPLNGITRYEVQWSTNGSFTSGVTSQIVDNATQFTISPSLPQTPNTLWYWRVRAIDPYGALGYWSALRYFFLDTMPLVAPTPYSPVNNTTTTVLRPYLYWYSLVGAKSYDIILDTDNLCNETPITTLAPSLLVPNNLRQGTYYWCVRATDLAGNVGAYSAPFKFTVNLLTSPVDNALFNIPIAPFYKPNVTPYFYWIAVPGVSQYIVQWDDDPSFTSLEATITVSTTYVAPPTLPAGDIYWQVIPVGFEQTAPVSRKFNINLQTPPAPTITAPLVASYLNTTTPRLEWTPNSAGLHEVQWSTTPTFTSNVFSQTTSNNYLVLPGLPNTAGTTWYWRVHTATTWDTYSYWSSLGYFTLDTVAPTTPVLSTPIHTSVLSTYRTPTFYWLPSSAASRYRLQVARDEAFTQMVIDTTTLYTYYTVPIALSLTNGKYFWRVNAQDLALNISSYSAIRSLSIAVP